VKARLLYGVLIGLAVAVAGLAVGRAPTRPRQAPRATRPPDGSRPAAAAPTERPRSVDPASIRDVFRFAGDQGLAEPRENEPARLEASEPPPAASGPRLVGLVSRAGRLAAALTADGEVVLAVPGERAAGVTVLSVGEEGVLVRHPDGREELLPLP
jgi:hypothetical protein